MEMLRGDGEMNERMDSWTMGPASKVGGSMVEELPKQMLASENLNVAPICPAVFNAHGSFVRFANLNTAFQSLRARWPRGTPVAFAREGCRS